MNTDFAPIIQYVKENAHKPLSTFDVAKEFSLSQKHLSRAFTKHTGETLVNYRNRCRIEKVKQLLAEPRTIKQIAPKAGFTTLLQMQKAFKKVTGMTPTEYRKSLWGI